MEIFKVWCKHALFLLHFLIHCNACQIQVRGLKSCGIHPRLGCESHLSGNIIHTLDWHKHQENSEFFPISVFIMGTILSSGVPKLTKSTFDGKDMPWSADFRIAINISGKMEVRFWLRHDWRTKIEGQSFIMVFLLSSSDCLM